MKSIRLLIAATLITTVTAASARSYDRDLRRMDKEDQEILFIVSTMSDEPEVYDFESPEKVKIHLRERASCVKLNRDIAAAQVTAATKSGFQSAQAPSLIFAQKDNKFSFGIGGFINVRTSYDFNGTVENIDFVTSDIPIPGNYSTRQQLMMDASTSRLFLSGVVNSKALGTVEIFADMDFRGNTSYDDGIVNNYQPRLRCAYVSFLGFTLGRDITTFCDLDSAPQTVDFEGPNAYSFNYATVIRYERTFCNDRLRAGIALEQPNVSGTYGSTSAETFEAIPQRVPDVPMYIQCRLGRDMQHHFRVSGVIRDMYLYNATTDENTTLLGWGVQASGRLAPFKWMGICFNGTYGEGITPYIQDLNGLGLDFTPNPANATQIQTMPMYAWQAAANFNLSRRLTANGGYSTVNVQKENGYYSDTEYKQGQYVFGNLFYAVTPRMQVACEYLYGKRSDMGGMNNSANRASLMAQFNF